MKSTPSILLKLGIWAKSSTTFISIVLSLLPVSLSNFLIKCLLINSTIRTRVNRPSNKDQLPRFPLPIPCRNHLYRLIQPNISQFQIRRMLTIILMAERQCMPNISIQTLMPPINSQRKQKAFFSNSKTHDNVGKKLHRLILIMQNNKQIYRSYRYILVGEQGVGKTNIITRFLRDEFVDSHNLILEGQQRVLFTIKQTRFELIFEDKCNVSELTSLPVSFWETVDGIMFVFSLESEKSFTNVQAQLRLMKNNIQPHMDSVSHKMASILVGNKSDITIPMLEMIEKQREILLSAKTPLHERACNLSAEMKIKYIAISAKCSSRAEIEELFLQLINQNQIYTFSSLQQSKSSVSVWGKLAPQLPCCSTDQSTCLIY